MNIYFDELYRYDRINEHSSIAIPFPKGKYNDLEALCIMDDDKPIPLQSKVTARWDDGSVKWGFFRFLTDLKKFSKKTLSVSFNALYEPYEGIKLESCGDTISVDTGMIAFSVCPGNSLFSKLTYMGNCFTAENFSGPNLVTKAGNAYEMMIDSWEIVEQGPLVAVLKANGRNVFEGKQDIGFEITITAFSGKSYIDIGYRIINTSHSPLRIKELTFDILFDKKATTLPFTIPPKGVDSTGCGDKEFPLDCQDGPVLHTMGTTHMSELLEKFEDISTRICIGASNYRTEFYVRGDGGGIYQLIDSDYIIKEANEHFSEVFYGTFFVDRCDGNCGIGATVYKAQQNYPKALYADNSKISIMIVPECDENVTMESGMSRTQKFMLHFHDTQMSLVEIDNRSLIYQMPDRAYLDASVYRDSGAMLDVFTDKKVSQVERMLIARGDNHSRAYGMLNYGDAPDPGYTKQNRGNGEPVWTNNEYDFPHACALMYARSGIRRFLDYMLVAAEHWMDVDICHYSDNPLHINGQWEHTNGHCKNGTMVCSHEWVEGLLDYYHFTGDIRAYNCAVNIGYNVLRLLETPMFKQRGEINARETGWALRTLVALYTETNDESWLEKCEWIVGHFKDWEDEYGHWLSPYTDNTAIRVPFMISIAVGSLMRYYRVRPRTDIKDMILRAVDDMIENCLLDEGVFYYKQLPSLDRLGGNPLVLEALAIAYEITGDKKYLESGLVTFKEAVNYGGSNAVGAKVRINDAVIAGNNGTKGFAQAFIPYATYYKAIMEADLSF